MIALGAARATLSVVGSHVMACRLQGHVAVEESSTATGGSDESSNSSPQQDEDLCAEVSDDEQEKPLTHVDNAPPPPLRRQLSQDKTGLMFTWDQVRMLDPPRMGNQRGELGRERKRCPSPSASRPCFTLCCLLICFVFRFYRLKEVTKTCRYRPKSKSEFFFCVLLLLPINLVLNSLHFLFSP